MPEHSPQTARYGDNTGTRAMRRVHDQSGRVPPQAADIERSVLGAILLEPKAAETVIEILGEHAFYLPQHESIYQAVRSLFKRDVPADLVTTTEELRRRDALEAAGGVVYLSELTTKVASAANVEYHARILAEKSLLRTLIETMTVRVGEAYDPGTDAFDLLDRAETDLFRISETHMRPSARPLQHVLKETVSHLTNIHGKAGGITGVPSGFHQLDKITGGWQKSDLIIIASRPSMGKCLAHDARIVLADGSVSTIRDIVERGEAEPFTLQGDGRFAPTRPSSFLFDGHKPVFRVTTRLGRRVDTTLTHPFLTQAGWTPLSALRAGDAVAVPRRLPVFGRRRVPAHRVLEMADTLVGQPVVAGGLSAADDAGHRDVPAAAFTLERPLLARFLRRVFERCGHFRRDHTARTRLILRMPAQGCARDVQHLLVRFGILATLRRPSVLEIGDPYSVWTFVRQIGVGGLDAWPAPGGEAAADVHWDEIVSIDALGIKPVYDLTIPRTHNFVADDVCVHNTALALSCARNAALKRQGEGTPVLIFSLEMSARQLAQRLLSSEARIDAQKARTGTLDDQDLPRLAAAAGVLGEAPIYIDDTPGLGILELRAKCRRLKAEWGIGLVIVDYLQLMHGTATGNRNSNREQEIALISRSLKALAKELDLPVIALSQLNRSVETRGGDKRPLLSDLRESGSIEQDADVVAFIYRAERYGIQMDASGRSTEGIGEIIIGKQRNGPVGIAMLSFVNKFARFENLAYAVADPGEPVPATSDETPF